MMKLRLIKTTKNHVVYKIPKFSDLNNKLLVEVRKGIPAGVQGAVLLFGDKIKNEQKVSKKLAEEHNVAIIYAATPRQIIPPEADELPPTLKPVKMSNDAMLRQFVAFDKKMVIKQKKLTASLARELQAAKKIFRGAKNCAILKKDRPVAQCIMARVKDYTGITRNWLGCLVRSDGLPKEEMLAVERYFYLWIKKTVHGRIYTKARAIQPQIQTYVRQRGFTPKAVTVMGSFSIIPK